MRQVVWTALAVEDLRHIRDYIAQFNPGAAARVAAALVSAADSLEEFAERGRPTGEGRREIVSQWPYLIRYRIDGQRVIVLRIRHGARRPDGAA